MEENSHYSSRNNNFNILRFIAAVFVIIGHMYYITGSVPFVVYGQAVSTIGVKILFLLSGYFITISYLSDDRPRHLIRYAVKRVFRIFPALIFVVVTSMSLDLLSPRFPFTITGEVRRRGNILTIFSWLRGMICRACLLTTLILGPSTDPCGPCQSSSSCMSACLCSVCFTHASGYCRAPALFYCSLW